jgi:sigma-B regulation protein RsbU (phosphoserine phosphatase)
MMMSDDAELLKQVYASPILIVDDNALNRVFLEHILQSQGFTHLLSVAGGREALDAMPGFQPDMVILDVMMPGMDGFECCDAIRVQPAYRDVPIIMQTVLTETHFRARAFEKGATDFVSKPIYPGELYRRVRVHLEKRLFLKSLQLYKTRIARELDSARELQQAILPAAHDIRLIEARSTLGIASHFQPSSEISGDFWGLKEIVAQQVGFWTVDFSGHGVAAALNAFRLQAYLNESSELLAQPGDYLSIINDKLLHLALREQFATMFYGVLDMQGDSLHYACACSPHPIILRSNGQAELIDGSGYPLGIGDHTYPTQRAAFYSGDTLLLYSDALIETPDASGAYITEPMLMQWLSPHANSPADAIKDTILHHFRRHSVGELLDDLTIVVCKRGKVA